MKEAKRLAHRKWSDEDNQLANEVGVDSGATRAHLHLSISGCLPLIKAHIENNSQHLEKTQFPDISKRC